MKKKYVNSQTEAVVLTGMLPLLAASDDLLEEAARAYFGVTDDEGHAPEEAL